MSDIKVYICGVAGNMGREVVRAVRAEDDMVLVGGYDVEYTGTDVGKLAGCEDTGVKVDRELPQGLAGNLPDVVVDFTHADALRKNLPLYLEKDVSLVIGTTGLGPEELEDLSKKCEGRSMGCLVAPNFAIGAVLMMRFSQVAARYMEGAEIIEFHHPRKKDAPSGTSIRTAEEISKMEKTLHPEHGREIVQGVRGGIAGGVRIHSVRLPGFMAHQEVIFGGNGQTLSIRHDSLDRSSFMPGVMLAIRHVHHHSGCAVGLDSIMEW